MSRANQLVRMIFVLAFALLTWGCSSTANENAPKFDAALGEHPSNWMATHYAEFIKNPEQCRTCHGSTTDKTQAGGTSNVSCFKCHANDLEHPAGWAEGQQHGLQGAMLAAAAHSGFASCTKCHGADYGSPIGLTPSCTKCHTKAPHPAKPWRGTTSSGSTHARTVANNAPECFKCHANGANSSRRPATPAPAGTAPGCYNATLCHG